MKRHLRTVGRVLLGALYPPRCLSCRGFLPYQEALRREKADPDIPQTDEDLWFCKACLTTLPRLRHPTCPRCAKPASAFLDEPPTPSRLCVTCDTTPPAYHQVRALYEYGGAARDAVHHLKFNQDVPVAKGLGALLAHRLSTHPFTTPLPPEALVVPIPLDPERGRKTPFNHAGLIARHTARRLSLFEAPEVLHRTRTSAPQRDLSRADRLTNLQGAFEATEEVKGRSVLLIDDVMTTGATVGEAARALKSAGAEGVWVAAVCRTF